MTLTPTKDLGATAKAVPGLYGEPQRLVSDEELSSQLKLQGLNAPFIADLLSGFLTHERCGTHLYRSVAERSNNPILKQRYKHFGQETSRHVEILEQLILTSGGNPNYVSPMARAVEASDSKLLESTFLVSGTLDPMTAETAMLDAVFIAETVDQANWQALQQLGQQLPDGELKQSFTAAAEEVLSQEDEHLGWAHDTRAKLTMLQAKSSMMAKAGEKAEEMMAKVREWLS